VRKKIFSFLIILLFSTITILFFFERFYFEIPNTEIKYIDLNLSIENDINYRKKTSTSNFIESDKIFSTSKSLPVWIKENEFLNANQAIIQGYGPDIKMQNEMKKNDYINILVVGDSHVYGEGTENTELRWERMLQYYLNKSTHKYGKKIFNVIPIGRGGSSFNNYIEWLTDERIRSLKPDAIIFSVTAYDNYPSFTEKEFCIELNSCLVDNIKPKGSDCGPGCYLTTCITGESTLFGKINKKLIKKYFPKTYKYILDKYCDPDKLNIKNSLSPLPRNTNMRYKDAEEMESNPYYKIFEENVKKGSSLYKKIPKFIYHVKDSIHNDSYLKNSKVFIKYGYNVIPSIEFDELAKQLDLYNNHDKYHVNIADKHPNGVITSAYGKDVSNYILKYFINSSKYNKFFKNKNYLEKPVFEISNYSPAFLKLSSNNDIINISYNKETINIAKSAYKDFDLTNQFFPCARVNFPHSRIVFSRDIEKLSGKTIKIKLIIDNDDNFKNFFLQPFGIDNIGNEIFFTNYFLTSDTISLLDYKIPEFFSGFMIIDPSKECDFFYKANDLNFPTFEISFSLVI
jgi:hypothetical protein